MTSSHRTAQLNDQNPWLGLESFKEADKQRFYGRAREVETLLSHVRNNPATVLYGRSGLGKTSLIQAGLFPRLRHNNYLPIRVRFDTKSLPNDVTPEQAKAELGQQLRRIVLDTIRTTVADATQPAGSETLWEYLHRNDFELWSERNQLLTPVIVLDQFEELFRLGERIDEFRNALGDLIENRIPAELAGQIAEDRTVATRLRLQSHKYTALISMREDYLPDLEGWCGLIPTLSRSRMRLLPLQRTQAVDAVYKPAATLIDERLARRLVDIVSGAHQRRAADSDSQESQSNTGGSPYVEPALLSLFCRELNEVRKRRGWPQFDDKLVEEAGTDILSNYYASCISDLPNADDADRDRVARFIETELISDSGVRNSYVYVDAIKKERLTKSEFDWLQNDRRLLRLEDLYGAPRIELIHDVLTGIVATSRDERATRDEEAAREAQAAAHAVDAQNRQRHRDATARRLVEEAKDILAQRHPGGDVRAFQQLLVARSLAFEPDDEAIFDALIARSRTVKIIDADDMLASVAFSADGKRVATAGVSNSVRLWDATTGEPIGKPLTGHSSSVKCVAFSPDRELLASCGDDDTVRLWNADNGAPEGKPLTGHTNFVFGVAFNSDGTLLASCGGDMKVLVWDTESRSCVGELEHNGLVRSVAFSPNGGLLASASWDGLVRIWDLRTFAQAAEPLSGHVGFVRSVSFSHDGNRLVSGGDDCSVRIWDAHSGQPLGGPITEHQKPVWSVAFSPDGTRIASAGADQTIRVWDAHTRLALGEPLVGHTSAVQSLAFSPDSALLASAARDGTVRLWDPYVRPPLHEALASHSGGLQGLAFSPDGTFLSAAGTVDHAVHRWDVRTGERHPDPLAGQDATDTCVAFSPGSQLLATAGNDGTVSILDASSRQPRTAPLRGGGAPVKCLAFNADGTRLASADTDNIVRLWDTHSGKPLATPERRHTDEVNCIAFSSDGKLLASGGDDGAVQIWDAHSGRPLGPPLRGHTSYVYAVTFSPDGHILASAGADQTVRRWNVDTHQPLVEPLTGHKGAVCSVVFSSDGQRIVSGSRDTTVQVWDARTGDTLGRPFTGHTGAVRSLAFSPDRQLLASTGDDGEIRLWPGESAADMLSAKLSANMSRRQWREWVSSGIDYQVVREDLPIPAGDGTSTVSANMKRADQWVFWEPLALDRGKKVLERLTTDAPLLFDRSTLVSCRWSPLAFYEAHRLVELEFLRDQRTQPAFALVGIAGILHLDGASAPLHQVNETESLELTEANVDEATVIDYIRYFMAFLRSGDDEPWVLIESGEEIQSTTEVGSNVDPEALPQLTLEAARRSARPPLLRGHDVDEQNKSRWLADVTIVHRDALYSASLAIYEGGQLEMIHDDLIGLLGGLRVQAPALRGDSLGTADPDELARWAVDAENKSSADPGNLDVLRATSISLDWLADARVARGELDGALRAYLRSKDIAERLARTRPENRRYQHDLAVALTTVGDVYMVRGDAELAVEPFTQAVDILDRLADGHPEMLDLQVDLSDTLDDLGDALVGQSGGEAGQSDIAANALHAYTRSLDIARRLADTHPDNAEYQRRLARQWVDVGRARTELDDNQGALQAHTQALTIAKRLTYNQPDHQRYQRGLAVVTWYTASTLEELGDTTAIDYWRKSHETLCALDAAGRLVDEDRPILDDLAEKLSPPE